MNIFDVKIWDDESKFCTFYTVLKEAAKENETDKFFIRYEKSEFSNEAQELIALLLNEMGNEYGAHQAFFNRDENEVKGLPPKKVKIDDYIYWRPHFPLRLYALKISEGIVVLFNGGIKDDETNQKSSLHLPWAEACGFAKRILKAIEEGDVLVDNERNRLTNSDGEEEIIL